MRNRDDVSQGSSGIPDEWFVGYVISLAWDARDGCRMLSDDRVESNSKYEAARVMRYSPRLRLVLRVLSIHDISESLLQELHGIAKKVMCKSIYYAYMKTSTRWGSSRYTARFFVMLSINVKYKADGFPKSTSAFQ